MSLDFKKIVTPLSQQSKDYILSLNSEDFSRVTMNKIFNKKFDPIEKKIKPPMAYPETPLTLEPNTLLNQKNKINTTVGLYVFNKVCIESVFGDRIPYHNETIADGGSAIANNLVLKISDETITAKEFLQYKQKLTWITYFSKLFFPGFSDDMMVPDKEILKERDRLFNEHKDVVDARDQVSVVDKIEKPLLKLAKEKMEKDPSGRIYESGAKPKLGNAYKEMYISIGPQRDTVTGKYTIMKNSLSEETEKDKYDTLANMSIFSSYSRAKDTAIGGNWVKLLASSLQQIKVNPEKGHDCGTKLLLKKEVTKYISTQIIYSYYKTSPNSKELKLITADNIDSLIGKTIYLRTPLFCNDIDYCNMCFGELANIKGSYNIGMMLAKIGSEFMYISMKRMHDTSIKTIEVLPSDYIIKVQ